MSTYSHKATRAAVAAHLDGTHAILWGRAFDIIQDRDAAIDWLTDVVTDVEALRRQQRATSSRSTPEPSPPASEGS